MACSCQSKGPCGTKTKSLRTIRTKASTLYNITSDPTLKAEYKAFIAEIDEAIKNAKKSCPSQETIDLYQAYINAQ
jgi:hypothetical protein